MFNEKCLTKGKYYQLIIKSRIKNRVYLKQKPHLPKDLIVCSQQCWWYARLQCGHSEWQLSSPAIFLVQLGHSILWHMTQDTTDTSKIFLEIKLNKSTR